MVEHGQEATEATRENDDAAARIAQARAWAEREVQQKRLEAREAGSRLLELEARRARELEDLRAAEEELAAARAAAAEDVVLLREELEKAHETLRAIQRTRVWRIASAYWRLRDRLLRRR
jgi:hypothetical protein